LKAFVVKGPREAFTGIAKVIAGKGGGRGFLNQKRDGSVRMGGKTKSPQEEKEGRGGNVKFPGQDEYLQKKNTNTRWVLDAREKKTFGEMRFPRKEDGLRRNQYEFNLRAHLTLATAG